MFIAFEGPDNTGKSTSAANLAHDGVAIYNVTKELHAELQALHNESPELPITYDRIDWLSHQVYRLGMPDHEWNDERVRTVFAMPDTHLVFKLHVNAEKINDELYATGALAPVNEAYTLTAMYLMMLNQAQGYKLFKTISVVHVIHDQASGSFQQQLAEFSGPVFPWGSAAEKIVHDDESLLEMLRHADANIG